MLPDNVLRVVALPPTISRMRLPRRFLGSMSRVASLCAIIESLPFWRLVDALLPELPEILRALQQFALPLFFRRDQTGRTRNRGCDIGPARQLAAVLPGEVEQHRKHLRREFDGYVIDPVEHVVSGQMIEAFGRALADVDRELVEMG